MSNLKESLIRLGARQPRLRKDIRPILAALGDIRGRQRKGYEFAKKAWIRPFAHNSWDRLMELAEKNADKADFRASILRDVLEAAEYQTEGEAPEKVFTRRELMRDAPRALKEAYKASDKAYRAMAHCQKAIKNLLRVMD